MNGKYQIAALNALRSGIESYDKRQGWRGPIINVYKDTNWSFLVSLYPEAYPNANESSKINLSEVLTNNFHTQHEKQYGKSFPEKNIQIVVTD